MRKLLVVLVVVGLLGFGADRAALAVSTHEAQQRLVAEGFRDPQVDVDGFPFLTQLLRRDFDDVTLDASSVTGAKGSVTDVSGQAHGLAVRGGHRVHVGSMTATGTVPYDEVLARVSRSGLRLTPAGAGQVRVSASVSVLGQRLDAHALAKVTADGTTIHVTPTRVGVDGAGALDTSMTQQVSDRLSFTYEVRGLPQGVRIDRVTPAGDGFVVHLSGSDLSFTTNAV
jgi:hypothetical protein